MQEQDATIENSEVEKVNTESPDLAPQIPKPLQITPKVEKQNIRAGTNEKEQQGESSCTKAMKSRKTESKRASKRAVNNENSPNNKKRRSQPKSKQTPHEGTENFGVERDSTDLLKVSQEQVKVQGMIQNAINTTESEIERLEEENRIKMINDNQEEDEPSLLDATDSTISEVENMLKETRRLLSGEVGEVNKPQTNADQGNKVAGFTKKSLPNLSTGKLVKSKKNQSNSTKKKPLNEKLVNSKSTLGDMSRPGTPVSQTSTSEAAALSTPSKTVEKSEKERAIIACLVTKLSSSHGWRCTICRAVFSSKAETEEHVGVSHVLGNLS